LEEEKWMVENSHKKDREEVHTIFVSKIEAVNVEIKTLICSSFKKDDRVAAIRSKLQKKLEVRVTPLHSSSSYPARSVTIFKTVSVFMSAVFLFGVKSIQKTCCCEIYSARLQLSD
jgi:hypothetical protein